MVISSIRTYKWKW